MTRGPRLLPLVAFAALCLVALKLAGLILGGGYMLSGAAPATARDREAVTAPPPAPPAPAPEAKPTASPPSPTASAAGVGPQVSPTRTELDVLESLALRRRALDQRERDLELRENLLKAAEASVEARIAELKSIQARIETQLKRQDEERKAQHDRLVQMYAAMKPKDAASIFNRMDLHVMTAIVAEMSPRVISAILAEMNPDVAQRLTMELANRSARPVDGGVGGDLPKIQGRGPS